MKTYCTLFLLLLLATVTLAQTIRRVNNNPGVTGTNIYTTIQAAHDAATSGDIIYVEPSGNSYGNLEMTKQLSIYGNGYFLDKNVGLKADNRTSRVGIVNIYPGASGSTIEGLNWENSSIGANNIYGASNVTIARNYIRNLRITVATDFSATSRNNITGLIFRGNFIQGYGFSMSASAPFTISNTLITNNFLQYIFNLTIGLDINNDNITNTTFQHNIVVGDYAAVRNMTVANCIFITNNETTFTTSSGNVAINVSFLNNAGKLFPSGNGNNNIINVKEELVQVFPAFTDLDNVPFEDAKLQLKDTSPLKTAGTGGSEVGMFGGTTPYKLSGISTIPSISKLDATPTGSSTTPLSVTISTKSNN